ncbi:MAG TPA: phage baseplate assembly protein V, partial [Chitinophagales bacterium]|nr:phage baseplate assembly protein V [Chitinophagales bacterium]
MSLFVGLNVEIDGRNPFHSISGFSLTQSYDFHHHFSLRVPLDDIEEKGIDNLDKSKSFIGKTIKIEIGGPPPGVQGSEVEYKKNQFNGVITEIGMHRNCDMATELVLSGYSPTILLDHGANTRQFNDMTLSSVVNSVVSKYPRDGISYKVSVSPDPKFDFLLQYRESSYNFLARLANLHGQWFYFNGKECVFGRLESGEEHHLQFGSSLLDFHLGAKLKPSKFKTKAYDYVNNKQYDSGQANISGLDSLGKFAYDKSNSYFFEEQLYNSVRLMTSAGDVNDIAKFRRGTIVSDLVVMSGQSENFMLNVGSSVNVKGPHSNDASKTIDYGTYTILKVTHVMDGSYNYQNSFEAIPSAVEIPPLINHVTYPVCEPQPAIVVDNNDPQKYGRIKIRFYWQDNAPSAWARVATPHGGNNRGISFVPEVNDEVLVAFEGNDPDQPVIIGSLYHGKATQNDRHEQDNTIKTIRTISGNEIKFNDKSGEEELTLINKDGSNQIVLSMKDNSITIQAKGKINIKAEEINITADKDINIKGANINVNAQQKISAEATSDLSLKGMNVDVNANANFKTDAKGQATITGVSFSATGQTTAEVK